MPISGISCRAGISRHSRLLSVAPAYNTLTTWLISELTALMSSILTYAGELAAPYWEVGLPRKEVGYPLQARAAADADYSAPGGQTPLARHIPSAPRRWPQFLRPCHHEVANVGEFHSVDVER